MLTTLSAPGGPTQDRHALGPAPHGCGRDGPAPVPASGTAVVAPSTVQASSLTGLKLESRRPRTQRTLRAIRSGAGTVKSFVRIFSSRMNLPVGASARIFFVVRPHITSSGFDIGQREVIR